MLNENGPAYNSPNLGLVWEPKDKGEFPDNGRWLREPQKQKLGEEKLKEPYA